MSNGELSDPLCDNVNRNLILVRVGLTDPCSYSDILTLNSTGPHLTCLNISTKYDLWLYIHHISMFRTVTLWHSLEVDHDDDGDQKGSQRQTIPDVVHQTHRVRVSLQTQNKQLKHFMRFFKTLNPILHNLIKIWCSVCSQNTSTGFLSSRGRSSPMSNSVYQRE